MAHNRNNETEGKGEKKEERGEETSVRFEELFVSEKEKKTSKCESCVSEGLYDRVSIFLCLVCEIYVCAGCMDEHRSHDGMEMWRKESERKMEREEMEICGKKSERESEEMDKREKRTNKKPGILEKIKKRLTKTVGKAAKSEARESENERTRVQKERMRKQSERQRKVENFVDQLLSESDRKRTNELKKKSHVSICDRVNVKHELDQKDSWISGFCGLENRRWVVCDWDNSCTKIFKLGNHVIQRYIRFVGAGPWDVTEIDLKQNSAEPSLVSGIRSGISGTDRADANKQCFIAVTLPEKRQIMFIDVSEKPALLCKVIHTGKQCRSIQFYDDKIFTVCRDGRRHSPSSVYIKSTDGHTLNKFDTGIYGYFPYLAVVSGRVYLTDWDNQRVQCRNVDGQVIKAITIKGSRPVGISVDPDNNVYVCAWWPDKVYKLDGDLTRYMSVLDQIADYAGKPYALCYYRDKLFISHEGPPSLCNFVTVVRLP